MGKIGTRTARVVGGATAALLLSGAVAYNATTAGAVIAPRASSADFVATIPAGYLALQLRTDASTGVVSGQVLQYNTASTPAVVDTQTFSITRCEVTTDGHLLQFVPSVGKVGIYNNGLGTKLKNNCTPAEGRTSAGETFTVNLGSKFNSSYAIDAAELDIEGKFGASLVYSGKRGTTEVLSGAAPLATSNDNGPDAGTGDNTIVSVGTKGATADNFTSLALSTATGEFGLDGGGDGVYPAQNSIGTNDSVFFLTSSSSYDYTVGCQDTLVASADDISQSDTSNVDDSRVSGITYVRLANKNQADCANIGVTVKASDTAIDGVTVPDQVFIDNSLTSVGGVPQNVRARVQITWTVQTAGKTQSQIDAELAREIQFTTDGARVPVANCTSVPTGFTTAQMVSPTDTSYIGHPAGFPWCLMADVRTMSGTTIIQTQYYSGNGDPRIM